MSSCYCSNLWDFDFCFKFLLRNLVAELWYSYIPPNKFLGLVVQYISWILINPLTSQEIFENFRCNILYNVLYLNDSEWMYFGFLLSKLNNKIFSDTSEGFTLLWDETIYFPLTEAHDLLSVQLFPFNGNV